jgi:hypothetical protein
MKASRALTATAQAVSDLRQQNGATNMLVLLADLESERQS